MRQPPSEFSPESSSARKGLGYPELPWRTQGFWLAVLLPLLAAVIQWFLWPIVRPFVWFLFFPAVFLSAQLGGFWAGLASTLVSAFTVVYVFMPPMFSLQVENPNSLYSVGIFLIMGVLFSVTHERLKRAKEQAETALKQVSEANGRLSQMNEQVTGLYEKLRDMDRLKTEFFTNVSHELRTPLTLIMGPVKHQLSEPGLAPELRRTLEMVQRNANILYRHVNDLLDIAKFDAGSLQIHYTRTNVAAMVRFLCSNFGSFAEGRNIRLEVSTPPVLEGDVDCEKFERILLNLLSNAFKFVPEGGWISISLNALANSFELKVEDNGPGIPEDLWQAVFERFRQVDGGPERRQGGTGLGLSIVKQFAELHGGSVLLGKSWQGGASFTVRLPLKCPEGVVPTVSESSTDASSVVLTIQDLHIGEPTAAGGSNVTTGPLVLIVEDNHDMRLFLSELLRKHYRITLAKDGLEGLSMTKILRPDLILSDIMMPGMSGDHMVTVLKEDPLLRDIPIVMLSAKMEDDLRVELLKKGVADFVLKPFSPDELLLKLNSLLEKLRHYAEAQSQLAAIVHSAQDAIIGEDLTGRIIFWNQAAERMYGYSEKEALGQSLGMLLPEDRKHEEEQIIERIVAGESIGSFETVRKCRNGDKLDVSLIFSPIRDQAGRVVGVSKIARNLAERKDAQQALKQSLERYHFLFDNMLNGFAYCRMVFEGERPVDFEYLSVNKAFSAHSGLTDVVGKRVSEVIPGIQQADPALFEFYGAVVKTGIPRSMELYLNSLDIWFSVTAYRPEPGCFVSVFDVITERKKAEQQVQEQAALLDKANDAIYVRDLDGRIFYWNEGAEQTYGWSKAEVLGKNIETLGISDQASRAMIKEAVLREGSWSGERRQTTKTGGQICVFARLSLVNNDHGLPVSVFAINTDITEKKQMEEQLLRAQRLENLGSLAGGIAHDLNNILAPVLLGTGLLKEKLQNPEDLALISGIEDSARRGADVVRQVLTFARGVSGERVPVIPGHLLREMRRIITETFPKDITLKISSKDDLWPVVGDATQLHQVLLNLCINARDAMSHGGRLTLSCTNVELDAAFSRMCPEARPGPYVRFSVEDTGEGIPPSIIDKIFDPFFTTKEPGRGTGLGLSTVLGIVKSHGGILRVKSVPGEGSLFDVYLPANPVAKTDQELADQPSLPIGNGEWVLVVDDEVAIREVVSKVLELRGYKVITGNDGTQGLALFMQHRESVRLVITDMLMPGMDGATLTRVLRQAAPEIPIIGITGFSDPVTGPQGLKGLGVAAFIYKPFTARQILQIVAEVLAGVKPADPKP